MSTESPARKPPIRRGSSLPSRRLRDVRRGVTKAKIGHTKVTISHFFSFASLRHPQYTDRHSSPEMADSVLLEVRPGGSGMPSRGAGGESDSGSDSRALKGFGLR